MMRSFISLTVGFILMASAAMAQVDMTQRALMDRLDMLERDVTLIQRKVYKGGDVVVQTDAVQVAGTPGSNEHLFSKMAALESANADLTRQLEELRNDVQQANSRLDKINADVNMRFEQLKKETPVTPAPVAVVPPPIVPKSAETKPQQAYDDAYALLRQSKYPEAEEALKAFLVAYPTDDLTGNAQYWLGETYYVRGQYDQAAVTFAQGFQKYKQSTKGPDNLLKLGLSMANLGKTAEACAAFTNFEKEFPKANSTLKVRAKTESDKLACVK